MSESDMNAKTGKVRADTSSHWLLLSVIVIVIDQITKWMIVQRFELYDSIRINAVLNITRAHNTGAAFSFLSDQDGWQRWLFVGLAVAISVGIMVWLRRLPRRGYGWLAFALALVLGGAIGNVIDRVHYHHVIDFIQVHWETAYFPTFNVADMAISVGAFVLILDSFFGSGRQPAPEKRADASQSAAGQD